MDGDEVGGGSHSRHVADGTAWLVCVRACARNTLLEWWSTYAQARRRTPRLMRSGGAPESHTRVRTRAFAWSREE
jgi:hypothetical protein